MPLKSRLALIATGTLMVSLLGTPTSQASPAEVRSPEATGVILATDEAGCSEIAYFRAGLESAVRPLVPARFKFNPIPQVEGQPPRVALLINEITCASVQTVGWPQELTPGPITTVIVSTPVTSGTADGSYVLFHATQNPVQYAAFRLGGWTVDPLGVSAVTQLTRDPEGSITGMSLTVGSGRWKHQVATTAPVTLRGPEASSAVYYRDTSAGHLSLCFANQMSPAASTRISGDLTATPLPTVTATPPVFDIPGFFSAGGWRSTLTTGPCPVGS